MPSSTADFVGDLEDVKLLARALKEVDAVVHTAALHASQVGIRHFMGTLLPRQIRPDGLPRN